MAGQGEFLQLFGHFTIADLITFILAILFCVAVYKLLQKQIVLEAEKDKQMSDALSIAAKYPDMVAAINDLKEAQQMLVGKIDELEKENSRRELAATKETLTQWYRHYTNLDINPNRAWHKWESAAFFSIYDDYEQQGGNSYVHSVIVPEMRKLTVIEDD